MVVELGRRDSQAARRLVPARFLDTVAARPRADALRWRRAGAWRRLSWNGYAGQVARMAAGLSALGVEPGDRVGLLLRNRPEFHVADLGALFAGAVPVSFYNTSPPERLAYLAGHSRATVIVVDDASGYERVEAVRSALPDLRDIVVVDDAPPGSVPLAELASAAPPSRAAWPLWAGESRASR